MCCVQHSVGHSHVSCFVLCFGHQVHRRSDHAATRRLRSGYPVVCCVSGYDSYAVLSLLHAIWTRKENNGSDCDRDLADEERSIVQVLLAQVYSLIPLHQKGICCRNKGWQLYVLFGRHNTSIWFSTVKWVRDQDLIPVRATDFSYLRRI